MTQMAWLDFERGWMAGVATDGGWMVLAASDTGWWKSYEDEWDQQQEFKGEPPHSLYIPQRGLGWVWSAYSLKERIGYAVDPGETNYQGQVVILDDGGEGWKVTDPDGDWHVLTSVEPEPEPEPEPVAGPVPVPQPQPELSTLRPWEIVILDRYDPRLVIFINDIVAVILKAANDTVRVELKRPYGDKEALRAVSEYVDYMEDDGRFVIVFSGKWAEYLRGYLLLLGNAVPLVNGGP